MKHNQNENFNLNSYGPDVPQGETLFRQTCSVVQVRRGLVFAGVYLSAKIAQKVTTCSAYVDKGTRWDD